jgi:ABC-type glycerol-3-phosphate transport system permease component
MRDTATVNPAPAQPWAGSLPWWKRKSVRNRIGLLLNSLIIVAGAALMLMPLAWMISTSLKPDGDVFIIPIRWIPKRILWSNYPEALTFVPFVRYYLNSIQVTSLAVIGAVLSASCVAFAFARLRVPGKNILFAILLSTLMLPEEVTLVPVYLLFKYLGWLDTYRPLIVPSWFGGSAFYIFLLRQFFLTIPTDLDDAAKIDGASLFDIYARIIIPLSKPALATVAIFSFFSNWNSFRDPLIYLNTSDFYTIPVGLRLYLSALGNTHWNYLMAATLMSIIPPLVIFFTSQRYFVQGAVLTGLKS